jgi:hypothetical protein
MPREIERALAALLRRRKAAQAAPSERPPAGTAFRAVVYERLGNLEEQLREVKGRVNGLIFLIAGAVVVQILQRLIA